MLAEQHALEGGQVFTRKLFHGPTLIVLTLRGSKMCELKTVDEGELLLIRRQSKTQMRSHLRLRGDSTESGSQMLARGVDAASHLT